MSFRHGPLPFAPALPEQTLVIRGCPSIVRGAFAHKVSRVAFQGKHK